MKQILQNYGSDALSIAEYFNPDFLLSAHKTAEDCYFGDYPALSQLGAKFGEGFPTVLMMIHLHDLSEYCGCKEKLFGRSLEQCARVIANDFYYLKVTELLLFFHRFKSGWYDRFYGSVDPLIITTSLRDFLRERANFIDRHEQEEKAKERETWKKNAITYEEYVNQYKKNVLIRG